MKKISLILVMAGMVWALQPAHAQTTESTDTSKNKIEVKKKVKTGAHGRQVTKIKMTGKGTQGSIHDAADGAVTGTIPAPVIVTPPPPPPPPEKVNTEPTVIVVTPEPEKRPDPEPEKKAEPTTTTVTTTSETKPMPVEGSISASRTTHHVVHSGNSGTKHVYHHVYTKKPAVASSTKTTTTTTIKKGE